MMTDRFSADELSAALGRLGTSAAELGRTVVPPVERSHISEMANGKRKIGPVMAERLRAAIQKLNRQQSRRAG